VFSGLALWQAYGISGLRGLSEPGVFPMLAAGTMLVSALFIVRDSFKKERQTNPSSAPPARTVTDFFRTVLPPRLLLTIAFVAIYIAAMPTLGFLVSSALFLLASFAYLWRRSALISVGLTALSLTFIYVIFRLLFQVVLPRGSLFTNTFLSTYL